LEKALIIGEKLSTIYNGALFRGADGGCSWEQWLKERLPKLLPEAEGRSTEWGKVDCLLGGPRGNPSCILVASRGNGLSCSS
jgi:hypothetical protein